MLRKALTIFDIKTVDAFYLIQQEMAKQIKQHYRKKYHCLPY